MDSHHKCLSLLNRAKSVMPCEGAQTLSKQATRMPLGDYPLYITRGKGSHVWCADGHEYIAWLSALGPIILGHAYPPVVEAVRRQAEDGFLYSLEHPLTIEVAELLCDMVPCAEAVRFCKSGSDAVNSAVRLARTYTGRESIAVASNSYHGASDWFQVTQDRGRHGVPHCLSGCIAEFEYNDTHSLQQALDAAGGDLAAVVIEPARDFVATKEFLRVAERECRKRGAVLIWDEVITAFRLARGSAQEYFGMQPDLACLGKAMANGLPLSAVVGRRDIMDAAEKCFISGTYNGECLSLAAAKATLQIIRDEPVVEHIWRQGLRLKNAFTRLFAGTSIASVDGLGPLLRQTFATEELRRRWMAECAVRDVLFAGFQYANYGHTDDDTRDTEWAMAGAAAALRAAV